MNNETEKILKDIRYTLWVILALLGLLTGFIITHAQPRAYHALEASYIGLQAADVITTYKGIRLGAYEQNPAANYMLKHDLLIPGKILASTAFLYSCRRIRKENPKLAMIYLIGGNLVYGAVVTRNYQICVRLKI